jgi:hypothetical protein
MRACTAQTTLRGPSKGFIAALFNFSRGVDEFVDDCLEGVPYFDTQDAIRVLRLLAFPAPEVLAHHEYATDRQHCVDSLPLSAENGLMCSN